VLSLLVTLIRLRVNYHLLDNEQVFLNYVLRQFELVEEGLVAGPDSPVDQILPWLLRFLVLLSHDSIHSKGQSLVPFSKLIQLCDGLMASGFDKDTHC
jgi:huntingtin